MEMGVVFAERAVFYRERAALGPRYVIAYWLALVGGQLHVTALWTAAYTALIVACTGLRCALAWCSPPRSS